MAKVDPEPMSLYPPQAEAVVTTQPLAFQPQPPIMQTQNIVVVQQQGIARTVPSGDWSTGLCGCCEDAESCLCAYFCWEFYPCILSQKMGESCCLPWCVGNHVTLLLLRMKIRTMRQIEGGGINDCCVVSFCPFCAATQLSREWDNMKMERQ
ncbi:cornifelin-like [Glandiceps talaboti]